MENRLTVLVADDSSMSRKWVIRAFPNTIREECTIVEANNGRVALDMFLEHRPGITFLDLTMPEMNGTEVLEEIRKVVPNAYVVVVTADRQKSIRDRLEELKADKIIYKPIEDNEIHKAFLRFLTQEGE